MDQLPMFISGPLRAYGQFAAQNLGPIILTAVVVLVLMASAALASSVAESRGRGPLLHFVIGLLVPVAYPLLALFALRPPQKRERAPDADAKEEFGAEAETGAPPPAAVLDAEGSFKGPDAPPSVNETVAAPETMRYEPTYFKRIARDETGAARGPFLFVVDGQEVRAQRIVEVQPKLVIIETVDTAGKSQNLRVPFARIDDCHVL